MHDSCIQAAKALAVLHPLWVTPAPWRFDHSVACEPLWEWTAAVSAFRERWNGMR